MDKPELSGLIGDRLDEARSSRNTPVDALAPDAPAEQSASAQSRLSLLTAPVRLLGRLLGRR